MILKKTCNTLGLEENFLNFIKSTYKNTTTNVRLINGKLLWPWDSKQCKEVSALLFNTVLEFRTNATRQDKEIKYVQITKEKLKLHLFAGDLIVHEDILRNLPRKLIELISEFNKLQDTKSTLKNQLYFYLLKINKGKSKS